MIYSDADVLFIVISIFWGTLLLSSILYNQAPFSILEFLNPMIPYFIGVVLNKIYPWLGTIIILILHLLLIAYYGFKYIRYRIEYKEIKEEENIQQNSHYETVKDRLFRYFPETLVCISAYAFSLFIAFSRML